MSISYTDLPEELRRLLEDINPDNIIIGTAGDDIIRGGASADGIVADTTLIDQLGGDDMVRGGSGDDVILAFGGRNQVRGGRGDDVIVTADGEDLIRGNKGDDDIQSGRGSDIVHGGSNDDALRGGEGDDYLDGGKGNDTIIGGSQDDILIDGKGRDRIEGRTGDDTIRLTDDGTKDRVIFGVDDLGIGSDVIEGFDGRSPRAGGDILDLRAFTGERIAFREAGNDVKIFVGPEKSDILLATVTEVDLETLSGGNLKLPGASAAITPAQQLDVLVFGAEPETTSG